MNWWKLIATPFVKVLDWIRRILYPPPPPTKPYFIPDSLNQVPTGPNLVSNGSFELPADDFGAQQIVQGSGVVQSWLVLQNGGKALWINGSQAADGARYIDLTGGTPPGPGRVLATLYRDYSLGLQSGKSYEISVELGVGANNGPGANFGPPITVSVGVIRPPDSVVRQFEFNPLNPPTGSAILWKRYSFRFAIPAVYVLKPGNETITISGVDGSRFIGVDNVWLRLLT